MNATAAARVVEKMRAALERTGSDPALVEDAHLVIDWLAQQVVEERQLALPLEDYSE